MWYSPSVLNSGADGTFLAGNLKYTFPGMFLPMFPGGVGAFISADLGHWFLGTTDRFYGVPAFPNGIHYASYTTWDVGLGLTWKTFTLDLRYYDTDLSKGNCNAFTSAQTASLGTAFTPINPAGANTNWCSSAVVVKFSADLTFAANLK